MQNELYIPIILGTARHERRTEYAARYVLAAVQQRASIETEILDVREYRLPATDDTEESDIAKHFAAKASRADAFIIVAPEYNHGYPGELKMMLDMLFDQYARKPFAICGTSTGAMGGVRMVEQLRLVLIEFHAVPIAKAVYFGNMKTLFDASGAITDSSYEKKVVSMFDELVWFARTLKQGREEAP